MDSKEINRIFYRDGYRIASQHLEGQVNATNLIAGIESLHRGVDDLLLHSSGGQLPKVRLRSVKRGVTGVAISPSMP